MIIICAQANNILMKAEKYEAIKAVKAVNRQLLKLIEPVKYFAFPVWEKFAAKQV